MGAYSELLNGIKRKAQDVINSPRITKRRKNIEKVFRRKIKEIEPKLVKAYQDVRKKALKYGLPVAPFEERVSESFHNTMDRLAKVKRVIPFTNHKSKRKTGQKSKLKKRTQVGKGKAAGRKAAN